MFGKLKAFHLSPIEFQLIKLENRVSHFPFSLKASCFILNLLNSENSSSLSCNQLLISLQSMNSVCYYFIYILCFS